MVLDRHPRRLRSFGWPTVGRCHALEGRSRCRLIARNQPVRGTDGLVLRASWLRDSPWRRVVSAKSGGEMISAMACAASPPTATSQRITSPFHSRLRKSIAGSTRTSSQSAARSPK